MRRLFSLATVSLIAIPLAAVACGDDDDIAVNSGGSMNRGGSANQGGSANKGGSTNNGGSVNTGGSAGDSQTTGGSKTSGGSSSDGGSTATGGGGNTGGTTGGSSATGGKSATGGRSQGGSTAEGGMSGEGGGAMEEGGMGGEGGGAGAGGAGGAGGSPEGGMAGDGGSTAQGGAMEAGAGGDGGAGGTPPITDTLDNGDFEGGGKDHGTPPGWTITGTEGSAFLSYHTPADEWHSHSGTAYLDAWLDTAYTNTISQVVEPLPEGEYSFSIWHYGDAYTEQYIYLKGYDSNDAGAMVKVEVTKTPTPPNNYGDAPITVGPVHVTSGRVEVGIFLDCQAGGCWTHFDDAVLTKVE